MIKYLLLLFTLCSLAVLTAETNQQLKTNHDAHLWEQGYTSLLKTTHQFASVGNHTVSTYTNDNIKSIYGKYGNIKIFRYITIDTNDKSTSFHCFDKVAYQNKSYILKYQMVWDLTREKSNCQPFVEKISDSLDKRTVELAISKYGIDICNAIGFALRNKTSIDSLVTMVDPGIRLYQYIFSSVKKSNLITTANTKTIFRSIGISQARTNIYQVYQYPVLKVEIVRVTGGGAGLLYNEICAVNNVVYFQGFAWPNGSISVFLKLTVLNTPVPRKNVSFITQRVLFNKFRFKRSIDFRNPVLRVDAFTIASGLGFVKNRGVSGNFVNMEANVSYTPSNPNGNLYVVVKAAVYR